MLDESAPRKRVWKQALRTIARRWITGESPLFDLYVAEKDGAELALLLPPLIWLWRRRRSMGLLGGSRTNDGH
jgi:hypothetical protein